MGRKDIAIENFISGCNCCQAVVCTYKDVMGIDEKTALKIAKSYGGGRYNGICGAVLGMHIVANYLKGAKNNENPVESDEKSRDIIEVMESAFKSKNTSVICRELKGNIENPKLRSCVGCVEDAAEIIEKSLAF